MPQHVRGDHLGPVRQVPWGHANGLEQGSGLLARLSSGRCQCLVQGGGRR